MREITFGQAMEGISDLDLRDMHEQNLVNAAKALPRKEGYQPDKTSKPEGQNPPTSDDTMSNPITCGLCGRKEVISIQTGDVVTVSYKRKLSEAEIEDKKEVYSAVFPNNLTVLLDRGTTLEVYREQVNE